MSASSNLCLLQNAPINLVALREASRRQLFDIIESVNIVKGKKALVLDEQISGPLGLVCEAPALRNQGVDYFYHLQPELETDCTALIYIIRPKVHLVEMICNQIQTHQRLGLNIRYVVCYVPRSNILCEQIIESFQLSRKIQAKELALDFIPVDNDVLSMEMENEHRSCKLDGDFTALYNVAKAFMKLQSTFGLIPHIAGKGTMAKQVCDMMVRMRRELGDETVAGSGTTAPSAVSAATALGGPFSTLTPEIDTLVIIDRDVDLVTPMLSMLTYEGFVDEVFGIKNSGISVDPEIVDPEKKDSNQASPQSDEDAPKKRVILSLNSNDKIYNEIRDKNFAAVFKLLSKKAKEINDYYEERHNAKEVSQLRDFVKRLGSVKQEHQSLAIHTRIAEIILKVTKTPEFQSRLEMEQSAIIDSDVDFLYLEDAIVNRSLPLASVVRMLILLCQTTGIKSKKYDQLKTDIIQSYGYEALFTLENLERMNLIKRGEKGAFSALRKPLNLFNPDVNEMDPTDISYIYSGYAPLSARIVEHALSKEGFKGKDDVFKQLPGPTFEFDQPLPNGIQYTRPDGTEKAPVVLVFYIGGITHTEISAMRFISKNENSTTKADIIAGGTSIVNGKTLCESYCEYFSRGPFAPVTVPKPVPVAQAIKPTQEKDRQNAGFVIGGRGTQQNNPFELSPHDRTVPTTQQQPKRVWGVK